MRLNTGHEQSKSREIVAKERLPNDPKKVTLKATQHIIGLNDLNLLVT
jgi:hypothetical protein